MVLIWFPLKKQLSIYVKPTEGTGFHKTQGLLSENKFVTINGLFRIPSHLSSELHAYCKSLEDPEGMFKVQHQKGLDSVLSIQSI